MAAEESGKSIDQQSKEQLGLLFKNDPSLDYVLKHPISSAIFLELKDRYGEEHIPELLKEILSTYDEIKGNGKIMQILHGVIKNRVSGRTRKPQYVFDQARVLKNPVEDIVLANAIILTCRSSDRQCPTSMREIALRAGEYHTVNKVRGILDKPSHFNPDQRIKSYLKSFQEKYGLDNVASGIFLQVYRDDRKPTLSSRSHVTDVYAGGLLYYVSEVLGLQLTERDIAEQIGITEYGLRNNFYDISRRRKGLLLEKKEPEKLVIKFKDGLSVDIDPKNDIIESGLGYHSKLEVYERSLRFVQYLLENKHDEKNPIDEWSLYHEFQLSEYGYNRVKEYITGAINPILLGLCEETDDGLFYVNSQQEQKAETYVELMKQLVMMCRMFNLPLFY